MLDIFKMKPYLTIETLQNTGTPHLLPNKTSDKFTRRDIQFYDLYVKRENEDDVNRLKDNQFPLEIGANQYYQEMEIDDFNQLFWNQRLIEKKFGRSIKVTLECVGGTAARKVTEHVEAVKDLDEQGNAKGKDSASS